jgi:pyruvate formate lyase activating enzyme
MKVPLITEIQRFSLQDGPGLRTTLFVKGCPLHCPWCHNPETQSQKKELYYYPENCTKCGRCVDVCPTGASNIQINSNNEPYLNLDRNLCIGCMKCVDVCLSGAREEIGQDLSFDEIIKEALADRPFFKNSGGGISISGGEPLLFSEFTYQVAKKIKEEGVNVAVETSCFSKWEKIQPLLKFVDYFLVDIKTLDPAKHSQVVGCPLEPILENIKNLIESEANLRIHLPIISGFNDTIQDYKSYEFFLSDFAERLGGVDILPFHTFGQGKYDALGRGETYKYRNAKQISNKEVVKLARALKKLNINDVTIGGLVGMGMNKVMRKKCGDELVSIS